MEGLPKKPPSTASSLFSVADSSRKSDKCVSRSAPQLLVRIAWYGIRKDGPRRDCPRPYKWTKQFPSGNQSSGSCHDRQSVYRLQVHRICKIQPLPKHWKIIIII